jgi:hypothetical protein
MVRYSRALIIPGSRQASTSCAACASIDAACADFEPMVGYGRCIWSGGQACGRRTRRRICRSGSAGREWSRPSLCHFACHVRCTAPRGSGTARFSPRFRHSRHLFILRHFTGQLFNDVDGGTTGSPAASIAAESAASERHYRLALGLGREDQGQSHDGRTSGAAGYALRPSDEVREFGCQVVIPPAACRLQTCLSANMMVDVTWGDDPLIR